MEQGAIFTNWTDATTQGWAAEISHLTHRLHESELFSDAALARLIEKAPRSKLPCLHHVDDRSRRSRLARRRDRRPLGRGGPRMRAAWTSVDQRPAPTRDRPRLRRAARPHLRRDRGTGAGPPDLQAADDVPDLLAQGAGLLPLRRAGPDPVAAARLGSGSTSIRNTEPFLQAETMENIILGTQQEEAPYDPAFDEHATIIDLQPGESAALAAQRAASHRQSRRSSTSR